VAGNNPSPTGAQAPSGPTIETSHEDQPLRTRHMVLLAVIAIAAIALDQISKVAVFSSLAEHETRPVLNGLIELVRVHNTGAAFGILRNVPGSAIILTITTIGTIILLGVIFRPLIRTHLWGGRVALGLIYGGALGNLIDRVAFGFVRDFIQLDLRSVHDRLFWPAFNVADIAIVAGIILLLFGLATLPHHADTAVPGGANGPDDQAPGPAEGKDE